MSLVLDGVSKTYGNTEVLRPITLEIPKGEFLTVLGPSGSGKTTILRLVGGFTQPTSGSVVLNGRDLGRVPTNKRPFNTVFQDYALFPHMTVAQNVGYGLMIRRMPKADVSRIVTRALDVVGLSDFPKRYPSELSGGQRQRVALARAIVCEPEVVLLDEPLSALDAELRRQMQVFLKDLQRKIGATFLFVTHDQQEAISMSDRLVVMNVGGVEQIGTPEDIYYRPQTPFVASFFGDNNLCDAEFDGEGRLVTPFGTIACPQGVASARRKVTIAMRPELFSLGAREDTLTFAAKVEDIRFAGASSHLVVRAGAPEMALTVKVTSTPGMHHFQAGEAVTLSIKNNDIAVVEQPS